SCYNSSRAAKGRRRGKGMAADTAYAKRVLLACNGGGDAVSRGVAVGLARHGCRYSLSLFPFFFFLLFGSESTRAYRLVLVGDEGAL
uniref:Uncharacterized protein n=1 Tax=Aegilops tauschii subsp. strangulata TaxID=200361 RepID=A0A453MHL6_AEGTS